MLKECFGIRDIGKAVLFDENTIQSATGISIILTEKGIPYEEQKEVLDSLQHFAQLIIGRTIYDTMHLLLTESQISDMFDTMREIKGIEDNAQEV